MIQDREITYCYGTQVPEDGDGDAGVQCLAWSAPRVLSLTWLCPLLPYGEYN